MIPPRPLRKTIGNITYDRTQRRMVDPALEKQRVALFRGIRRQQVMTLAKDHLRRIMSEDGLAMTVRQLFDKNGRPPKDVSLASILRLYRMLEKQEGWLSAILVELHDHLKSLDHIAYRKDQADVAAKLRARHEQRSSAYEEVAAQDGMTQLPAKVRALVQEAIQRDLSAREIRTLRKTLPVEMTDMLSSRQIQKMMKYVFTDFLPPGDTTVPESKAEQFEYLSLATNECESLLTVIRKNLYDLREFVESADKISRDSA